MGRIADIIPALYHGQDNELIPFVDAIDVEVKDIERKVRGITDLINIDKCPDNKLPYLAALTNCPLIGDDPVFWRRQIRNWPYILKLKGTERSLELVLDSIGSESWAIKTFFRDADGRYITTKPTGQPFKDPSGLWRNIRTHYFDVEFTLSKDFVLAHDFDWDVNEVREKLRFWFEHGKPYHSELLHLMILPPKFLPDDHICRWDWCNWEHVELKKYLWGLLLPDNPVFVDNPISTLVFERGINLISDSSFWDFSVWGATPYRWLQVGRSIETDIFAALDNLDNWLIPYHWDDFTWRDAGKVRCRFFRVSERNFQVAFDLQPLLPQFTGQELYRGFVCDLRPYWDCYTWYEHSIWAEEIEQQPIASCVETPLDASLEYTDMPTWSTHKTWAGSDTWVSSTQISGACDFTSLTFQED